MPRALTFFVLMSIARAVAAQTTPPPEAPPQPQPQPQQPAAPPATDTLPTPTAEPKDDTITLEEWDRPDWVLADPPLSLVEIDGYFRARTYALRRLDLGNESATEAVTASERVRRYLATSNGDASYTGTNMRLRLEPTLNVSPQVQVIATVDVLDNLQLGSTPETVPLSGARGPTPVDIVSRGQREPVRGFNAITDSIVVKRLYARMTALNEQLDVRVGRMPNHWGLGMLFNSGDCLDCDYGSAADRLAVTFRAANHEFTPMFDWVSSGVVATPFTGWQGQPIDAASWDDASEYALRITKTTHPNDINEEVAQGNIVLNYGLHNSFRRQARALRTTFYTPEYDPAGPVSDDANAPSYERRDALLYTGDGFLRLFAGNLELGAEAAVLAGHFKDSFGVSDPNAPLPETDILQYGGAVELRYRVEGAARGPVIGLRAGGASGDRFYGFGALDFAEGQRGQRGTTMDRDLNNFQFSPDYHVDLLLFRRVIGTVTDAWYVSPEVSYFFNDAVEGRLNINYAQALYKNTVPNGESLPLGLELDGELRLGVAPKQEETHSLHGSIAGGILFPFGAFDNPLLEEDEQGGSFAWTLQGRLFIVF